MKRRLWIFWLWCAISSRTVRDLSVAVVLSYTHTKKEKTWAQLCIKMFKERFPDFVHFNSRMFQPPRLTLTVHRKPPFKLIKLKQASSNKKGNQQGRVAIATWSDHALSVLRRSQPYVFCETNYFFKAEAVEMPLNILWSRKQQAPEQRWNFKTS